jgi:orotate phosphoribosyltransferase
VDPLRAAELRGRRVLLVDDVMTSGASLYTAAQALRDAGAAHVTAVVLARTGAPPRIRAPLHRSPACSILFWSNPKSLPTPAT